MLGMSNFLHTNDSPLNLINLDALAKKTHLIQRKTQGFSPKAIILAFLKCLQNGDASFHLLASQMSQMTHQSLCRGAVYKRVNQHLVDFLEGVISLLLIHQPLPKLKRSTRDRFGRILIEDSTFVPMGAINAGNFPAHGNSRGSTAGFKLDLCFDVLDNHIVHQKFSSARQSDSKIGQALIESLQPGDLVLRDMGYFTQNSLQKIEQQDAHWVSRLPSSIKATLSHGKSLESKLKSRKYHHLDEIVTLGSEGHCQVRIVGVRADGSLVSQRRRERKKTAKKIRKTTQHQTFIRDGWHLIVTSLDTDFKAKELFDLYAIRWSIETRFKAWKQSLNLKSALKRYSNFHHLCCIALVGLIHQLIINHLWIHLSAHSKRSLSYEKVSEVVTLIMSSLSLNDLNRPITIEERHVRMDKRKRKSLHERMLHTK